MNACAICLDETAGGEAYHPRCLKALFGKPQLPVLDVEVAKLHTLALALVGQTTLSGVQRKISLSLAPTRGRFHLVVEPGNYILKPQAQTYPLLPENEHLTMILARAAGIEVPPCGLVQLADGTLAYLGRRFDRVSGRKLRQEDFCQLAGLPPKDKYEGSAELCARLVKRFASEPGIELAKLFRRFIFIWRTGNGDMHLKNFSLLEREGGLISLSPAYDLVATRLVIPDDVLALPLSGKRARLSRSDFLGYAAYCGVPPRAAVRILDELIAALPTALGKLGRSRVSDEMKQVYRSLLEERTAALSV